MPEAAYRVARQVARQLADELDLSPPFDIERVASRVATVVDEDIPTHADVIVLHAPTPGRLPRLVVDRSLQRSAERRRFAIAHGLGHVLLGWHALGTPCDVSDRPSELPVTAHDLVEGEANAFARELLMPAAWISSFEALEEPALLIGQVAERAGVSAMPAARAVALLLPPGHVWAVTDQWSRVLDAGRSPGTRICFPHPGDELEGAAFARHAKERHRSEHHGCAIWVWRFDAGAEDVLPRDRTARGVAVDIARDLGLGDAGATTLAARIDGIAGWANEQLGTASIDGMRRVLAERAVSSPELSQYSAHPEFAHMLDAKATELVAKRLAR